MTTLDKRGRVAQRKELAGKLRLTRGDAVVFESKGKDFVIKKVSTRRQRLEEVLDWNPERTGMPERGLPKDMKRIWKILPGET